MSDWKVGESKELLKTPIWKVMETEKTMPNGKIGKFTSLKAPNWVSAVIVNKDTGKFIMNREFRHGVNKVIIEFPCGTVEEGESAENACIREVKEETGFTNVKIVTKLYTGNPNPAFMDNRMTCFLVVVSGRPEKQNLDADEFITTFETDDPNGVFNDNSPIMAELAWLSYLKFVNKRKFYVPFDAQRSEDGLYHNYYVTETSKVIVHAHKEKYIESEKVWSKCGDYSEEDPGIFVPSSKFVPVNIWDCSISDWMLS